MAGNQGNGVALMRQSGDDREAIMRQSLGNRAEKMRQSCNRVPRAGIRQSIRGNQSGTIHQAIKQAIK
eukprot:1731896-Prymnesium_polylepis.1